MPDLLEFRTLVNNFPEVSQVFSRLRKIVNDLRVDSFVSQEGGVAGAGKEIIVLDAGVANRFDIDGADGTTLIVDSGEALGLRWGAGSGSGLDADTLDGLDSLAFVKADGTVPLTANWDVGNFELVNVDGISIGSTATTTAGIAVVDKSIPVFARRDGGNAVWQTRVYSNTITDAPGFQIIRSRGTDAARLDIQAGDHLGTIEFFGRLSGTFDELAEIRAEAEAADSGILYFDLQATGSTLETRFSLSSTLASLLVPLDLGDNQILDVSGIAVGLTSVDVGVLFDAAYEAGPAVLKVVSYSDTATHRGTFQVRHARGTIAAPTDIQVGDQTGAIDFSGYYSGSWFNYGSIWSEVVAQFPARGRIKFAAYGSTVQLTISEALARLDGDLELDDRDGTPVADRRIRVIDGLIRATDTSQVEGEYISAGSIEQGTGSGLDADLLDGNEATAFAAASHTHVEADITDLGAYLENIVEDTTPQLGGHLDCQTKDLNDIRTADFQAVGTGSGTGAQTIPFNTSQYYRFTVGAGSASLTLTSPAGPAHRFLWLKQDGTGNRDITFTTTVNWVNAAAPDTTLAGANEEVLCSLVYDGSAWYGSFGNIF